MCQACSILWLGFLRKSFQLTLASGNFQSIWPCQIFVTMSNTCHFPQISGISSSANELDTYPHSKYIWPIIPQISGLTVLITINIWGSHTVFPIYGIGHLLHVACVTIMYRATGLVG